MGMNTQHGHGRGDETLLLNVATLIADRRSLPEVFGAFAKRLIVATTFDYASLVLYEPDRRFGRVVASFPRGTHPAPDEEVRPIAGFHMEEVGRAPEGLLYRIDPGHGRPHQQMAEGGLTRAWTVPLFVDGIMQGQVTVARIADVQFAPAELDFLRKAATLLSGAVREHVRAQVAVREHARAAVISELSLLLHSGEPLEAFLARLPSLLSPAVDFDAATLVEFEGDTALGYSVCRETRSVAAEPLHDPGAVNAFAGELGTSLVQLPGNELPAALKTPARVNGADDSVAVAALKDSGTLLGAFLLRRGGFAPLDTSDTAFVELLATLLGQALSNRRRLARQQQELAEQRAISAIVADTAQETDPFELTVSFARHLKDVVPDSIVGFGFLQPDETVEFRIFGDQTVRVPLIAGGTEAGLDYWIHDSIPEDYGGSAVLHAMGVKGFTVTAARVGGTTLGYLVVGSTREGFRFSERIARQFVVLAQIVGPVLMQARVAREAARERELLGMVIESLSDGVLLLNDQLRIAYRNTFADEILEALADHTAPGGSIRDALTPDAAEQLRIASHERVRTRGRSRFGFSGQPRWLDYQFIPLEHPELRMLVVLHDATEEVSHARQDEEHRLELERAARLAALGGLVGGVAHELNNPLTAIIGFTELLIDGMPGGGPMADDLQVVRKEAHRARNIVRDLLSFARPGPLEREAFSVHGVLEHIRRMRRASWSRTGIAMHLDLADADLEVLGNEDRITQVLLNLVTNAEDAIAGSAAPRLILRTRREEHWAVIEVEDNGPGIAADVRDRIFEPFFTTKQGTGTGLGLSVSHTIISSHDGRMEVECGEDRGTIFRVYLPFESARADSEPATPRPIDRALNVLVVDDEPNVRKLCQRLVTSLGHRCSVADGPAAAAALVASDSFDIVLCDYRLAGASGDDVLETFVEVAPWLVDRTIIATGAASDAGVQQLSQRFGLPVLPKPYGTDELAALFEEYGPADSDDSATSAAC